MNWRVTYWRVGGPCRKNLQADTYAKLLDAIHAAGVPIESVIRINRVEKSS